MARVLVVEDDESVREMVSLALGMDHDVVTAADGEQAVALLSEPTTVVDAVVLDLMMPGMDGFDVLRAIRRHHPGLPVIMATAKAGERDRLAAFRLGADGYVSKPFDPMTLVTHIEEIIAMSPEQRREVREREAAKANLLRQIEQRLG